MATNIKVEGIYDQRTLKLLKEKGLRYFGFNFSPMSFNFIQEYVFLEQLIPLLDSKDSIHLHFNRSDDPMITKVLNDLRAAGVLFDNIYIECDEWSLLPEEINSKYYLNYDSQLDLKNYIGPHFSGLILDFSQLEDLFHKGVLNSFISNFYTRCSSILKDDKKIILKVDWTSNILPSLIEYFDFDLISLPINSKIEICYRNVDLNKLKVEMDLMSKSAFQANKF